MFLGAGDARPFYLWWRAYQAEERRLASASIPFLAIFLLQVDRFQISHAPG
jgi:hypothetical protein